MPGATIEQPGDAPAAPRAWTDPTCTEHAVEALTAGSPFWPFWRIS